MPILNPRTFVLLAVLLVAVGKVSAATELVYFYASECGVCRTFDEEVGSIYPRTDMAKLAPMRRIRVDYEEMTPIDPWESDIGARAVPTFVLLQDGKEVARLEGYSSDELFWMSLEYMLNQHHPE